MVRRDGGCGDKMKSSKSYFAKIYTGLREGYGDMVHGVTEVQSICQEYVDRVGLCVTVTPTRFVYVNGSEPGCIVGLINYPRFPETDARIRELALRLAGELGSRLGQNRISIGFPDDTVMLDREDMAETPCE